MLSGFVPFHPRWLRDEDNFEKREKNSTTFSYTSLTLRTTSLAGHELSCHR